MAQYLTLNEENMAVGDTVRIHQEILEGNKKRVQVFEGILIAVKNAGAGKSFVVRKIGAGNVGVEKIFPANLPSIKKVEVRRKGSVRRSKLYYLRNKIGKSASRIKEKSIFAKTKTAA